MIEIIPLARSRHGHAKDQETDVDTWKRVLADFPDRVRHNAANLAAHSHDITLVGDRLLVSCSWYNSSKYPGSGTGYFDREGNHTFLTTEEWDLLYPLFQKIPSSDGSRSEKREYTIRTEHLQ